MNRIERLAARLDDPLLVTGLVNVRYLTGLQSSNAAVLVEPDGDATLYTDFRYAEAAAEIDGVTFHRTPRAVVPALAELLSGRRIAVEASHLSLASAEVLREGGAALVSTSGVVEALRAVKEPGELDAMRRAAAISDRGLRGAGRAAVRRAHRGGARLVARAGVARGGRRRPVVRRHRRLRRERCPAACAARATPDPEDTLVVVDAGCSVDGYALRLHADVLHRRAEGRLREIYDLAAAQLDALAAIHPARRGETSTRPRAWRSRRPGWGSAYGHGLGHGVGLDVHEEPNMRPESEQCSRWATS